MEKVKIKIVTTPLCPDCEGIMPIDINGKYYCMNCENGYKYEYPTVEMVRSKK